MLNLPKKDILPLLAILAILLLTSSLAVLTIGSAIKNFQDKTTLEQKIKDFKETRKINTIDTTITSLNKNLKDIPITLHIEYQNKTHTETTEFYVRNTIKTCAHHTVWNMTKSKPNKNEFTILKDCVQELFSYTSLTLILLEIR